MTPYLSALSASPLTSPGLVGQVESNASAAGLGPVCDDHPQALPARLSACTHRQAPRQAGLTIELKSALRDAV